MTSITLRVSDGANRGRVFEDLTTPITIGREEGNTIQLNDERVSRYHLKIQEDQEKLVLTDLESTNGTRVNGEDVQLRVLRYGDMIAVGRSVLLYGSQDQIAARLAALREADSDEAGTLDQNGSDVPPQAGSLEFEFEWGSGTDIQATLHALEPPELPERLTPCQAAQLAELLEYVHIRLRGLVNSVTMDERQDQVTLHLRQWQKLLDLQSRLAVYLRAIGDPE